MGSCATAASSGRPTVRRRSRGLLCDAGGMSQEAHSAPSRLVRLVGVYDADGTLRAELAYWVGARLGRAHCALCDITHGLARPRSEWKTSREQLPVPFDTYHRDDQPDAVRSASNEQLPVVAAETSDGIVVLLGRAELTACHGSVDAFDHALQSALAHHGLTLPVH